MPGRRPRPQIGHGPELVRSTFGEFETRARDEIGDNSRDQDLVWRVGDDRAMLEFLTGVKLLVAVMPRLGGAMHETLSPARNPGLVVPAHPWIASRPAAMRVLLS